MKVKDTNGQTAKMFELSSWDYTFLVYSRTYKYRFLHIQPFLFSPTYITVIATDLYARLFRDLPT